MGEKDKGEHGGAKEWHCNFIFNYTSEPTLDVEHNISISFGCRFDD